MWSIDNRTLYAADGLWHRDAEGTEVWVVAVKATYDILPTGQLRVAAVQPPTCTGPVPLPGLQSPRYETDFGPRKRATDVVLVGHAHAQAGPVTQLRVGFRVGPVQRTLQVWGDRYWQATSPGRAPTMSAPESFTRMPLVFDRAFGGTMDTAGGDTGGGAHGEPLPNPAGRGLWLGGARTSPPGLAQQPGVWLPNLEDESHPIRQPSDRPPPAGVGIVASHWPPRSQFAGTHDEAWMRHRRPLPPEDQDPRFFQVAPASQQAPGYLRGGEPVTLLNVTPPGFAPNGRIDFMLPRLTLAFTTLFEHGPRERGRSVIHTVILEPDFPRVSVVHHMELPCHTRVNALRKTHIDEMARPLDREATALSGETPL